MADDPVVPRLAPLAAVSALTCNELISSLVRGVEIPKVEAIPLLQTLAPTQKTRRSSPRIHNNDILPFTHLTPSLHHLAIDGSRVHSADGNSTGNAPKEWRVPPLFCEIL